MSLQTNILVFKKAYKRGEPGQQSRTDPFFSFARQTADKCNQF